MQFEPLVDRLRVSLQSKSIKKEKKVQFSQVGPIKKRSSKDEARSDIGSDSEQTPGAAMSESETMYSSNESEFDGLFKSILDQHLEQIFKRVKLNDNEVEIRSFLQLFYSQGILPDDPRIEPLLNKINNLNEDNITKTQFFELIQKEASEIEKLLFHDKIIPKFDEFKQAVRGIFNECKNNQQGKLADYIPELAKANPENFGVSVCSIDGQRFNIGDCKEKFTLQSIAGTLNYCVSVEQYGSEFVHQHVGQEPSGQKYNAMVLNPQGKPHNPFINAGAIMICSILGKGLDQSSRFSQTVSNWQKLAADRPITFDNTVFLSERNNNDVNTALAYLMKSKNAFPQGTEIEDVVEYYTQCCSLESDTDTLSIIAATLANGGICPLNGERVLSSKTVQNCLSLMNCCGMNDYSGQFAYQVGLPAKSGVSGGIMLVIPGKMGICSYSPLLDQNGNSVRGVQFCEEISERLQYHIFTKANCVTSHYNAQESLQHYCAMGDLSSVKRLDFMGHCLDNPDYDGRTPLHLAASNGHYRVAKYLLDSGLKNVNPLDRYKNTPMDDARRGKHIEIQSLLLQYGGVTRRQKIASKKVDIKKKAQLCSMDIKQAATIKLDDKSGILQS